MTGAWKAVEGHGRLWKSSSEAATFHDQPRFVTHQRMDRHLRPMPGLHWPSISFCNISIPANECNWTSPRLGIPDLYSSAVQRFPGLLVASVAKSRAACTCSHWFGVWTSGSKLLWIRTIRTGSRRAVDRFEMAMHHPTYLDWWLVAAEQTATVVLWKTVAVVATLHHRSWLSKNPSNPRLRHFKIRWNHLPFLPASSRALSGSGHGFPKPAPSPLPHLNEQSFLLCSRFLCALWPSACGGKVTFRFQMNPTSLNQRTFRGIIHHHSI